MSQILYGVDGAAGGTSSLYTINKSTGKATLIGSIGFPTVRAIAVHPVTGVLYGLSVSGVNAMDLITINTTTGAGTLVAAVSGGSIDASDMGFHPTTGQCYLWNEAATDQLATLNHTTGAFVNFGASGITTVPAGLAFRSDGVLFLKSAQTVATLNLISGTATLFSTISPAGGVTLAGALAFDENDAPYSVGAGSVEDTFVLINAGLTAGSAVGQTGLATGKFDSLAFGPHPTYVPPTVKSIPPTTTLAPQTPCAPKSELQNGGKGKFGCNNGGVGWTSSYAGPYGTVPQHADPPDGETMTGKEHAGVEVWLRWYHRDYPSGDVEMLQRALVELADPPDYEFGRKEEGLLSIGDIEHAIGNEQGGFEASTVDLQLSDAIDRKVRILLDDQELEGDEVHFLMASDLARGAA